MGGRAFSCTPRRTLRSDPGSTDPTAVTPGPGTYGMHADMPCEGPKFSFQPRRPGWPRTAKNPGPGAYEPPQGLKIPPKTKANGIFGISSRGDPTPKNCANTPGPGMYGNETTASSRTP